MSNDVPTIKLNGLKKVIISGCHLHQWQGINNESTIDVFKNQGAIQLDPLNPAGRNHDVFLFSRIKNYSAGTFENLCYHENLVYEDTIPNTSAIFSKYAKLFHYRKSRESMHHRTRIEEIEKSFPNMISKIIEIISEKGKIKVIDLPKFEADIPEYKKFQLKVKQQGYWDRNILKYLGWSGDVCVVGRDGGFNKTYGLTSNFFNEKELKKPDLSDEKIEFERLKLKLRSFPVIHERLGLTVEGIFKPNSKYSWLKRINLSVIDLANNKKENKRSIPTIVYCKNIDKFYIVPSNWVELIEIPLDNEMRAIAPLDPIVYDRKLLSDIFGFEYMWEVYKRKKDRRWGYYVYPLLYNGEFIGRLEAKFEKKMKILHLFNYQEEKNYNLDKTGKKAFKRLSNRWKNMLLAKNLTFDNSMPIDEV